MRNRQSGGHSTESAPCPWPPAPRGTCATSAAKPPPLSSASCTCSPSDQGAGEVQSVQAISQAGVRQNRKEIGRRRTDWKTSSTAPPAPDIIMPTFTRGTCEEGPKGKPPPIRTSDAPLLTRTRRGRALRREGAPWPSRARARGGRRASPSGCTARGTPRSPSGSPPRCSATARTPVAGPGRAGLGRERGTGVGEGGGRAGRMGRAGGAGSRAWLRPYVASRRNIAGAAHTHCLHPMHVFSSTKTARVSSSGPHHLLRHLPAEREGRGEDE